MSAPASQHSTALQAREAIDWRVAQSVSARDRVRTTSRRERSMPSAASAGA